MSINLLLEKKRSMDDFVYELYSESSLFHANELSNQLDAEQTGETKQKFFVMLETKLAYEKYIIKIDDRPMVTFYHLSNYVPTYELIQPIPIKSFTGRNFLALSPEIHLIDVYRDLFSPGKADEWEVLLEYENKLFKLVKQRQRILGGTNKKDKKETYSNQNMNIQGFQERKQIEQILLKEFITGNSHVILVGSHALRILGHNQKDNKDHKDNKSIILEIISDDPKRDFISIKNIVQKELKRDIPVMSLTRELYIMKDFRIRRTTIKVGHNQKEVAYIYNSAQYDLVPFILKFPTSVHSSNSKKSRDISKKFVQIGNPFVLLRYLLLNIWIVRWIHSQEKINEFFAKKRLQQILSLMINFRTFISKSDTITTIKDSLFGNTIFQDKSNEYLGEFEDDIRASKTQAREMKRFPRYYPQEYYDYHKKYRDLRSLYSLDLL